MTFGALTYAYNKKPRPFAVTLFLHDEFFLLLSWKIIYVRSSHLKNTLRLGNLVRDQAP